MNASTIEKAKSLIERKIELFNEYERTTDCMLDCEIDNMLGLIKVRQDLAHSIDELDKEINDFYGLLGDDSIKNAVSNKTAFGDCAEELKEMFSLGQNLRACFNRLAGKEEEITAYVETQKEKLLDLIKAQNSDMSAKSAMYYGTVQRSENDYKLFDSKC